MDGILRQSRWHKPRLILLIPLLCFCTIGTGAAADTNPPVMLNEGGKLIIATNRARVGNASPSMTTVFSRKNRSDQLSFALVDQTQGDTTDNQPLLIHMIAPQDLNHTLEREGDGHGAVHSVLLYVHGFYNTTENSIHLANHVAGKIGFGGDVIVFAWPSLGSWTLESYRADAKMVDQSKAALSELLRMLDAAPSIDHINIISHSLGNRLLVRALAAQPRLQKLGQIILCSPDVERTEFLRIVPGATAFARGKTLWVSDSDRALEAASTFGGGEARAGLISAGNEPIVLPNMATIDVSSETSLLDFNHNAYMQVDELFADLADVFDQRAQRPWLNPAKQRHYEPKATHGQKIYYEFTQ